MYLSRISPSWPATGTVSCVNISAVSGFRVTTTTTHASQPSTWNFRFSNGDLERKPLVLNPPALKANERVDRTALGTALLQANPNSRDNWRFGIGFDLVRTIKNLGGSTPKEADPIGGT